MKAVVIVLALVSIGVQAQVYKCKDDVTGKITFSDVGCASTSAGEKLRVPAHVQDSVAARRRAIQDAAQAEQAGAAGTKAGVGEGGDASRSSECQEAKRAYEVEAGAGSSNPKLIAAKRSQMYIACGVPEPTPNQAQPASPATQGIGGGEDKSRSSECQQAKRAYEVEAGAKSSNAAQVSAKRSQMYIACGVPEPAPNIISNTGPARRR